MTKNDSYFYLLLKNKLGEEISIPYKLAHNPIANLWIRAMKHLRNVRPHSLDSYLKIPRDVKTCYHSFCDLADIKPINFDKVDNVVLNKFHEQYMEHHDRLSRMENSDIIYEFHQSIHRHERKLSGKKPPEELMHRVAYNRNSKPFHSIIACNLYYADSLETGNIYLYPSDSGKRPFDYWESGEPNEKEKINKTMIAHYTFKVDWFVCLETKKPSPLPKEFYEWFKPHRSDFLSKFGLKKWDHIDEHSTVLLATPQQPKQSVTSLIKKGFSYQNIHGITVGNI